MILGHRIEYWQELEERFAAANPGKRVEANGLLMEVIDLRSRGAFYESRIKQMAACMERRET